MLNRELPRKNSRRAQNCALSSVDSIALHSTAARARLHVQSTAGNPTLPPRARSWGKEANGGLTHDVSGSRGGGGSVQSRVSNPPAPERGGGSWPPLVVWWPQATSPYLPNTIRPCPTEGLPGG